jgi:hypothetical protein
VIGFEVFVVGIIISVVSVETVNYLGAVVFKTAFKKATIKSPKEAAYFNSKAEISKIAIRKSLQLQTNYYF